jgi:hypothetical protein
MPLFREIEVQAETYRAIKNVIEKGRAGRSTDELQILDVSLEHPVDGRADIVLTARYKNSVTPLLVIETKRKASGVRFDPLSSRVISQAKSYARKLNAELFATLTVISSPCFRHVAECLSRYLIHQAKSTSFSQSTSCQW